MESLQPRTTHRCVTAASPTLPNQAGTLAVSLIGRMKGGTSHTEYSTSALALLTRRKLAALLFSTSARVLPGKLGALRTGQLLAGFLQEPAHHLQGRHTEQDQN